jgi:riboflavin kinase / FMN adenylyltransferase
MRRHSGQAAIPADAHGAAIALGNFDGVHLGHQAVIASAHEAARRLGATLGAAVFEPHPRCFFQPHAAPFRLQTSVQRDRALNALGVREVFELGFDAEFAQLSDRDFAQHILVDRIGAAHVSVGRDFRFGCGRMGDAAALAKFGADLGFSVEGVASVERGGARVSSTAIREALAAGDIETATALLTRPWAIEGEVLRGFARGRGFGFPTANLSLDDYMRPRLGIYAVRAKVDGATLSGVASIGVNPTTGALAAPVLEAHLFDYDADLYGKTIEIAMIAFLRDEAHFADVEAMKRQMADDALAARAALAR